MEGDIKPATATVDPQVHRFVFSGTGSEYFRIWIVNLVLSIITLGIYSAWAKVRRVRYFYGCTTLDGATFDYHADPVRILKGRIIFAVFVLSYSMGQFYPPLFIIAFIGLCLFPFFLVRGMIFNLTNTSYRGVRFGFERDYRGSYRDLSKTFFISLFSLGLFSGVGMYFFQNFRVTRSRFGRTPFTFKGDKWKMWGIYMRMLGLFVLGFGAFIGIITTASIFFKSPNAAPGDPGLLVTGIILLGTFAMYGWMGFVFSLFKANIANFIHNNAELGPVKVRSRYVGTDLFLVYLGNFFMCMCTLGLAWPWAVVELAKYRANHTAILASPEELAGFVQGASANAGAVGAEALDFWDIDIGF